MHKKKERLVLVSNKREVLGRMYNPRIEEEEGGN